MIICQIGRSIAAPCTGMIVRHRRVRERILLRLPFETNAVHPFFQLMSRCCERGSVLITSDRSESGAWYSATLVNLQRNCRPPIQGQAPAQPPRSGRYRLGPSVAHGTSIFQTINGPVTALLRHWPVVSEGPVSLPKPPFSGRCGGLRAFQKMTLCGSRHPADFHRTGYETPLIPLTSG
jgi:hypothetical protein